MESVTCSLCVVDIDDAEKLYEKINELKDEFSIKDIDTLLEYNNIIFDCPKDSVHELLNRLADSFKDVDFEAMIACGELVLEIIKFDKGECTTESLNMTLEEIAHKNQPCQCCGKNECGETDCQKKCNKTGESLSVNARIEELRDLFQSNDCDIHVDALLYEFNFELETYLDCQVSEDDNEEVYDLFYNDICQLVLFFAVKEKYTENKHNILKKLIYNFDFNAAIKLGKNILEDDVLKTARFWKDAKECIGCGVYDSILNLCIFVCGADGEIESSMKECLNKVFC